MTLQNLLRRGRLKEHAATAAVERNRHDAERFDAACKTGMQCPLAAMLAQGYRPSTRAPGPHVTLIPSLPLTQGVDHSTWVLLDALRRQRNANDHTGDGVTPDMVGECVVQGRQLNALLRQHLQRAHPALLLGKG